MFVIVIGLVCKSVNDVYIEHHHSIMARFISRIFRGSLNFNYIRIASLLGLFSRMIWNFFLAKTHTLPIPTSVDAEIEDLPLVKTNYNMVMSYLRRGYNWATGKANKMHISEPLKPAVMWDNELLIPIF